MILVCQKHVKQGLKMLYLPHVRPISGDCKCFYCEKQADFKLYNFETHRKQWVREAM